MIAVIAAIPFVLLLDTNRPLACLIFATGVMVTLAGQVRRWTP